MSSQKFRRGRVLAAVGAGLVALAPTVATAATAPRITKPADATKNDLSPARMYSSPYLAVDPSNPKVIVGMTADLRTRHCGIVFSTNGGATWAQGQNLATPQDYPNCVWSSFAGQAAMGRDGHAYVAMSTWDERDGGPRSGNMTMIVSRTDDLGNTWRPTIVATERGKQGDDVTQDRPAGLYVDSKSGSEDIVYVTFNRTQPNKAAPNAEPTRPMVAVSTDGGKTFGAATDLSKGSYTDVVRQAGFTAATTTTAAPNATTTTVPAGSRQDKFNQEANFGGSNARLAVDDKGTVYAVWRNATANLPTANPFAPITFISTSKDHGKTWTTQQAGNFSYLTGTASRLAWSKNGGANGTLVQIWSRNPTAETSGNSDVYIQRSTDGGKTWTDGKNITDDDPKALTLATLPTLSVAPNGRLDAAWFDTRDDPGIRGNDVFYAYSTDGGVTWSKNMRITDQTISRKFGVWQFNFDLTVPIGIASTDQTAVFGWDDTRNNDVNAAAAFTDIGGGVQDVYGAAVQFEKIGGGGTSKAAKIVFAAVLGLIDVSLFLVLAAFIARRADPAEKKVASRPAAKVGAGK